jgi:hypothetical protein
VCIRQQSCLRASLIGLYQSMDWAQKQTSHCVVSWSTGRFEQHPFDQWESLTRSLTSVSRMDQKSIVLDLGLNGISPVDIPHDLGATVRSEIRCYGSVTRYLLQWKFCKRHRPESKGTRRYGFHLIRWSRFACLGGAIFGLSSPVRTSDASNSFNNRLPYDPEARIHSSTSSLSLTHFISLRRAHSNPSSATTHGIAGSREPQVPAWYDDSGGVMALFYDRWRKYWAASRYTTPWKRTTDTLDQKGESGDYVEPCSVSAGLIHFQRVENLTPTTTYLKAFL